MHQLVLYSEVPLYKIQQNRFAQQEKTCSYTNRQGRLCSQCKSNHTVSAYSYTLECYHCESSTWSSVLQYIAFTFVPLSIFLVVVMVFRISITSLALNMPVVCCQFLSSPFIINSFLSSTRDSDMFNFVRFLATVYGIWNLDLFVPWFLLSAYLWTHCKLLLWTTW